MVPQIPYLISCFQKLDETYICEKNLPFFSFGVYFANVVQFVQLKKTLLPINTKSSLGYFPMMLHYNYFFENGLRPPNPHTNQYFKI